MDGCITIGVLCSQQSEESKTLVVRGLMWRRQGCISLRGRIRPSQQHCPRVIASRTPIRKILSRHSFNLFFLPSCPLHSPLVTHLMRQLNLIQPTTTTTTSHWSTLNNCRKVKLMAQSALEHTSSDQSHVPSQLLSLLR